MDTVDGMRVFVRVAQRASFAAAARELRLSPAAVTKQVAALEARVGARLLDRTTRRVAMTEAGRVYLERCLECLQTFDDADASVSELSVAPRGQLRISAPVDMHSQLPPVLAEFARTYPDVRIDLQLSNRAIDLVDEGFDLAIRAAPMLDGRHVARPLADLRLGVYASPQYLRAHGRPRKPADLARHRALVFVEPRLRNTWMFERDGKQTSVEVNATITGNSGDVLREMTTAGLGVFMAPSMVVDRAVAARQLERVLREWTVLPKPKLWAVYPHRRFLPAKVRLFVEALRAAFGGDPDRDPWWT
ncbi:MAG TPA: LysR substrate-binding domain-containing protein [Kofleriaceae bacterium]|nr:LysR substrate-binding domain-containing protein [Kofleriaceae bacterium]